MEIKFAQPEEAKILPICPPSTKKDFGIGLKFTIQRDDSTHSSTIKYRRLDNNKEEIIRFSEGYSDKTIVVYDGYNLNCTGFKPQCNKLPDGILVPAIIYEIDFNPRYGSTLNGNWERSVYTLETNYYEKAGTCAG